MITIAFHGQMLNESPFDASAAHPEYFKGKGYTNLFKLSPSATIKSTVVVLPQARRNHKVWLGIMAKEKS